MPRYLENQAYPGLIALAAPAVDCLVGSIAVRFLDLF